MLPRLAVLGWALVGVVFLVALWGPILNLPEAVLDVSPFQHLPHLPGGDVVALPLVVLVVLAAALFAASAVGTAVRDIGLAPTRSNRGSAHARAQHVAHGRGIDSRL